MNPLGRLRDVWVVGGGLHAYQRPSDTTYVTLGTVAVRRALADAAVTWPDVDSAYIGTGRIGMAAGRELVRYLGATGLPVAQVENASASGSTAFRQAVQDVASGWAEVSAAVGVDKHDDFHLGSAKSGVPGRIDDLVVPFAHFALLMEEYVHRTGATAQQVALVAVKNHGNGSLNPFAHRRQARTLEEVLAPPYVAGHLTRLQCTTVGEGAAAVLVASSEAMSRLGIDRGRAVRVVASASRSERTYGAEDVDVALTRETTREALDAAGVRPDSLDVVELHDAFAIEELLYTEAMGLAGPGRAAWSVEAGEFDINGRVAVSASGGLLSMGHPTGPTGVGQVVEVVRQLRGEAGPRQHRGASWGLTHMVGLGAVCVVHVLHR